MARIGHKVTFKGFKSKSFFGSCFILLKSLMKEMNIKSIKIEGVQYGLIINFEITQTFVHSEKNPVEAKYVFPTDLKMCLYDMTFVVGEEIIKPELKSKEEAKEIYNEALNSGRTVIYGSGDALTEFKLGNLPPNTEVKVIVKVAFTGKLTNEKTFFFKFPLDVYTQSGSQGCMYSKANEFSFVVESEKDKIKTISSNFEKGQFDAESKIFSIHSSSSDDKPQNSILLTFEAFENIRNSALITSAPKYEFCALTFAPNLPPSKETFSEFVFVIDCSGSMGGSSILRARQCLEYFIKSLPPGSYFNIIRFGSVFTKLFDESVLYEEENVEKAIELAQNLLADLGGTDIYTPLESIYKDENKHGQRQIFIITDGEVANTEKVFDLVSANSKKNRCFTIGLGRFCDSGLVEGIANLTGGKSDFVKENDSISEKVIPQLQASFNYSLYNIEIHVADDDSFEVSPFPIKSINYNGADVIFLRTEKKENSFKKGIIVNCLYGDEEFEFPIENFNIIENVEEDAFGCSGGKNIGKAISSLFAYNLLMNFEEEKKYILEEETQKAIELSVSSGVLCKYTGYVGMSEIVYERWVGGQTARRSSAGLAFRKSLAAKTSDKTNDEDGDNSDTTSNTNEDDKNQNKNQKKASSFDLLTLTRYQNIFGFWDNLDEINKMLDLDVKRIDGINAGDEKINENCIATILVVAAMHIKSQSEKNTWILIEQKAINWLKGKLPGIDINKVITETEKLIH